MACPTPSTLESFCVGGQLAEFCSNADGTFPEIQVLVNIINPIGGYICDPTNGAMLVGDLVYDSNQDGPVNPATGQADPRFPDGNDGCWCTCPLWANTAADPDQALQPGGTFYAISVIVGGQLIGGQQFIVQLDADEEYEFESYECGQCIPLKNLLDPLPTLPPTAAFCEAVENCLPPEIPWVGIEGPGIIISTGDQVEGGDGHNPTIGIDENYILGLTFDNCAEVLACFTMPSSPNSTVTIGGTVDALTLDVDPAAICQIVNDNCPQSLTVFTGINPDGAVTYLNEDGGLSTHQIWSTDPNNLITLDPTDNSLLLTLNVNNGAVGVSRPATAADVFIHDGNVTPDAAYPADIADAALVYKRPSDGRLVVLPNPTILADVDAVVDNGDNTTTITTTDDQGNETEGAVLNDLLVNAGAFGTSRSIDPDADILLHEGNVADGTGVDPATVSQIIKLDSGALGVPIAPQPEWVYAGYDPAVHATPNLAGSGTTADPYQIPIPDICVLLGQLDPAATPAAATDEVLAIDTDGACKRVTIPAAPVWDYGSYDPAVMTAGGGLAGAGTAADPYLIPLPDLCALLGEYDPAVSSAAATDQVIVLAADGTCRLATIPEGSTDTNTTYTLVDNDDSSFTLTDSDGLDAGTVGLCDLVDDLASTPTAPDGALYLYHDPASGGCGVAPVAAGDPVVLQYVPYDPAEHADGGIAGSGTTAEPYQIPLPPPCKVAQSVDYCDFDTAGTLPPRPVTCDGTLTDVTVLASTAPNGGDEVFEVFVNGASIGTATLASGDTVATLSAPTAVTAGDVITVVMVSTTATAASTFGSITTVVECA